MNGYTIPEVKSSKKAHPGEALLVASGDLRQSANRVCWPARAWLEAVALSKGFGAEGVEPVRVHPYDSSLPHGFIYNQRMGLDVFENIDQDVPLVVVRRFGSTATTFLPACRAIEVRFLPLRTSPVSGRV